jgi:hypothetical protein
MPSQEINLLNGIFAVTSTDSNNRDLSNHIVNYDVEDYNADVFEVHVVQKLISGSSISSSIHDGNGVLLSNAATTTDSSFIHAIAGIDLIRQNNIISKLQLGGVVAGIAGSSGEIKSAKLVIFTNSFTHTKTSIEVGNSETGTNTTASPLNAPRYWHYDSSKWDGDLTFFASATYKTANSMGAITVTLQQDNGSFASWADVLTIVNAGTSTTFVNVVSGTFTPTNGRNYRVAVKTSNDMYAWFLKDCNIIVKQNPTIVKESNTVGTDWNVAIGTAGTNQQIGQSFTTTSSYSIKAVEFKMFKGGVPTDHLVCDLVSGSFGGTVLASSASVAARWLPTSSESSVWKKFHFLEPIALSSSTKYYLQLRRQGSFNSSNFAVVIGDSTSNNYTGGGSSTLTGGGWSAEDANADLQFRIYSGTKVTKTQAQILLANTSVSSTGLSRFEHYFNPLTHVSGGTRFIYEASGPASGTTDIKLQEDVLATPSDVSGSTMIDVSNRQRGIGPLKTQQASDSGVKADITTTTGDYGQSFYVLQAYSLKYVDIKLDKTNTPTDNLSLKVYSGSIDGTLLGTSDNVAASSVTSASFYRFTFTTPVSLSASTTYYFRLFRSSASGLNYVSWYYSMADPYRDGDAFAFFNPGNAPAVWSVFGPVVFDTTGDVGGSTASSVDGGTASSGESFQAAGQSYPFTSSMRLIAIEAYINKTGSPSDNNYWEIASGSINEAAIATSDQVPASAIQAGDNWVRFPFSGANQVSIKGQHYFVRCFRTGGRDTSNKIVWSSVTGIDRIIGGLRYVRNNNVWSSSELNGYDLATRIYRAGHDFTFKLYSSESYLVMPTSTKYIDTFVVAA